MMIDLCVDRSWKGAVMHGHRGGQGWNKEKLELNIIYNQSQWIGGAHSAIHKTIISVIHKTIV